MLLGASCWVAVRRTYVFTLQEVEKICRTLQSHVTLHSTISYFAFSWWSRTASCFKEQVAIFSVKVTNCTRFHLMALMSSSSIILVQHCWLLLYRLTAIAGKKWPFCLTFESAFLPSYLKRAGHYNLQPTGYLLKSWDSFVNPFKLEVHSETTWPTPKRRHLAQCASFLLLGFWLSMATEKASRLMLVERRPMMLLGASCLFLKWAKWHNI